MHRRAVWPILLTAVLGLAQAGTAFAAGYQRHVIGDLSLPTPERPSPGLLLMGGGDRNFDALRWFLAKAGHGHVVVLRASQAGEIGEEFYREVGGVASVETFVFDDRDAASDPKILRALARADGIFIAGGDQSRYVRFWRGTKVAAALDAHVRAGKPLGGTSAGLAMLGEYLYGAMDGGSLTSPEALADPLGPSNTIETGFLHIDALKGVVTDTHFRERGRLGRLVAFVAKAESLAGRPLIGLGVDEDAAVAVEADGSARVYATAPGAGATLVRGGFAERQAEDEPMRLSRVETVGIDVNSRLHLPEGRVERPSFQRGYAVRDGVLVALDA
ncbi:MAG TPA: cyanophycinase, partial [Lysobacter sp.]